MQVSVYKEYLAMDKSISLEEMQQIHAEMVAAIGNDTDAIELYEELVIAANKYSAFRAAWGVWSREEKLDRDASRTSCHDSMIVKFNQLARYLKMQGKDTAWRDKLGYVEDDSYNRKVIGDFACYIVFVNSICAR